MNLENIFNPKSIAIVGASGEEGKVGNVIAKNILNLGYGGKTYLVNPKHDELFGKKCYKSLDEVENQVDLAIIVIPAKFVAGEIKKNADKIKNYVVISAGFSETGAEGKEREEAIRKIAEEKNLNVLGPNCLGFIIPRLKLNASFAGGMPKVGNIAFVSQSGALAVGIMDIAEKKDIRFSNLISIGNKVNIDESKILDYLTNDENTKVVGMYLEGIKNGTAFLKVAKEISAKKPVVILKAGKTEKSQKAISSHTGALAGSSEIISAVFEKCDAVQVENLEEFFDVLSLVSQTEPPANENTVVITNAGGPGVLATDAFSGKEIKLAEISEKQKEKLKKVLPLEAALGNPIDVLGDAHEDRYDKTLKIIEKDENVGSIVCVLTPQDQTPVAKVTRKIINFRKKSKKNISAVFIGGKRVEKSIKKLRENDIPNFEYPNQAISALNAYFKWSENRNKIGENILEINSERKEKAGEIIRKAKTDGRGVLYFSEAGEVMNLYGVRPVKCFEYGDKFDVNEISFPVVAKIDSDKVLHKTDKKALALNIKNKEELEKAASEMGANFPGEKIIIQPMLPRLTELILGIKRDEIFGSVVVCGLGGIYTEVFKMADFFIPPLGMEEIREKLQKSKIRFLFEETRGQRVYDIKELAGIISGIGQFALENEQIKEFDINPLLVYNNGEKAVAVDIKIII